MAGRTSRTDKEWDKVKLDLRQIFDIVGEEKSFDYEFDLTDYELYGVRPFIKPVSVKGRVYNEAEMVLISYSAAFRLRLPCDRCLDEFERDCRYAFEEVLVLEESEEHEEYVVVPDAKLDMDALCLSDILLNLPYKQLCDLGEDCKGLCPKCGANQNHTGCNCSHKEVDPRLAALGELLK